MHRGKIPTAFFKPMPFMKLGDIKGEFAPSRKADGVSDQVAQFTNGGVHQQVPWTCTCYPNWDVICDIGTSIKQTSVADALTNYRPEVFSEGVSSPAGYTDFVPAIALRSDNRFVIEPVNLFQGLDAGSMNYAEAIGMDSSTVGVMNNVISSLQPANEII